MPSVFPTTAEFTAARRTHWFFYSSTDRNPSGRGAGVPARHDAEYRRRPLGCRCWRGHRMKRIASTRMLDERAFLSEFRWVRSMSPVVYGEAIPMCSKRAGPPVFISAMYRETRLRGCSGRPQTRTGRGPELDAGEFSAHRVALKQFPQLLRRDDFSASRCSRRVRPRCCKSRAKSAAEPIPAGPGPAFFLFFSFSAADRTDRNDPSFR